MNETVKSIPVDGVEHTGRKLATAGLLMNPAESLAAQIRNARAVYGSVDMQAGEVHPAPVAKMTPKERRLAEEAMSRPIF
jgi:hypothetical protein